MNLIRLTRVSSQNDEDWRHDQCGGDFVLLYIGDELLGIEAWHDVEWEAADEREMKGEESAEAVVEGKEPQISVRARGCIGPYSPIQLQDARHVSVSGLEQLILPYTNAGR